jgi:hypothetical protein
MKGIKSPEKRFADALLALSHSQSLAKVFDDFLDFSLLFIRWWDRNPADYASLEKTYPGKHHSELFAEAYLAMHLIADNSSEGCFDPFGDFYMEHLSNSRTGQFFTPYEVCKLTAQMTLGDDSPDNCRIADPCSGSGRLLMAAAEVNPRARFYAADIDLTCCKMTVLNYLMNAMCGEVAWMDTLLMTHWRGWTISKILVNNGEYLPHYKVLNSDQATFPQMWANTVSKNEDLVTANPPASRKASSSKKPDKPPSPQLFIDFD